MSILDSLTLLDLEEAARQADTPTAKAAVWRDARELANALYGLTKDLAREIVAADPDSRGYHNDGRPVELRRRFTTDLLPGQEDQLREWLKSRGVSTGLTQVTKLTKDGIDEIKRALVEDGEKAPGTVAGYGDPYLAVGR